MFSIQALEAYGCAGIGKVFGGFCRPEGIRVGRGRDEKSKVYIVSMASWQVNRKAVLTGRTDNSSA